MTEKSNGDPGPLRVGFNLPVGTWRFVPQGDITALEVAEAMAFMVLSQGFQVAAAAGAPPPVLMKTAQAVAVAWRRLPAEVKRHFEFEPVPVVAEAKKPGLIIPGGGR